MPFPKKEFPVLTKKRKAIRQGGESSEGYWQKEWDNDVKAFVSTEHPHIYSQILKNLLGLWDLQFKTYLGRAGVHLSLDWQWKLILTGRGGKSRAKPTMRLFLGQIPHSGGGAVFGDIKFHIRALHGRDYTSQGGDKTCFGEGRWGKGFTSSFTWYIFIFLVQNRLSCKGDFFHWFWSKTPSRQNLIGSR